MKNNLQNDKRSANENQITIDPICGMITTPEHNAGSVEYQGKISILFGTAIAVFRYSGGAGQNKDRRDSFFLKDSDCSAQHQPRRRLEQKPASKVSLVFEDERYERKVLLRRPSP